MASTSLSSDYISRTPVRTRQIWLLYLLGCLLLLRMVPIIGARLSDGVKDDGGYNVHLVLGTYWASGDAANRGLNPYAAQPLTLRVYVKSLRLRLMDLNLNPPLVLPLFQALARLRIAPAAWVWTTVSYLLFVLSGALLMPTLQKRQAAWMLLSMPVISTLAVGQLYALLLLLSVLIWRSLRRGHFAFAGLCLGAVVALKPIFLLWPVFLILRGGYRRVAWISLAAAMVYSLLPVLIYGPEIYAEWFRALGHDQHYLLLTDISLTAVCHRFGYMRLGWMLATLTVAGCAAVAARRRSAPIHTLSIVCSCLCAPLAWSHYLMLAYPWFLERNWNRLRKSIALLLLIPEIVVLTMRIAVGPHWLPLAGTVLAMSAPLLLLIDASIACSAAEVET